MACPTPRRPVSRAVVAGAVVAALAAAYLTGALFRWGAVPHPMMRLAPDPPGHAVHGHAAAYGGNALAAFMGDFGLAGAAGLAAVSCAVRASSVRGRLRSAWLLFAASALTAALGNAVWGWYELFLRHEPPTPSAADWVFLFFAPFAMAGTLVHHRGPGSTIGWIKLLLDGSMIAGAIFCAGWGPALAQEAGGGRGSLLRVALRLAYPVFDILLVSLVLALRFRGGGRSDGTSMAALLAAYTTIVLSDAIWTIPSVRAEYASGGLLDSGWFLGYLLLVIAPWMSVWSTSDQRDRQRLKPGRPGGSGRPAAGLTDATLGLLAVLFPYAAGAVCLAGIMVDGLTGDHRVRPAVLAAGGTVLAALVARQAVTLLENRALTRQLAVREDHFRSLVQGSSDVITTMDPSGRIGYVSPAVEHVFGYRPEDLVGACLFDLVHPEDCASLRLAVANYLTGSAVSAAVECRICSAHQRADGPDGDPWRHAECTLTRHRGGLVFTCRDVSDRIALQRQLAHTAYHDALTGLPNRALFTDRLEQAVARAAVTGCPVAVLFLDLDRFKEVNDAGGHAAGDVLLTRVAARLRGSARSGDTVARFGGDEFAALVEGGVGERAACEVAARFQAALSRPFHLTSGRFTVGASIGVAFWRTGSGAAELMHEADLAMYEAKADGKGRIVVRRSAAQGSSGPAQPDLYARPGPDVSSAVPVARPAARS